MKKIYYILTVAFLTLCFISNTSAQLTIVKAVIVDTNDDGYADALEIKFNQPIDWSESNDEDDDWLLSNNSDITDSVVAVDFTTVVEYIADASADDDEYARVEFNNPSGPPLADDTNSPFYYLYIQTNGPNDAVVSLDHSDTLRTMTIPVLAEDYSPPKIASHSPTEIGAGAKLGVEDTIKFDLTLFAKESAITILPDEYNGQDLNWTTSDSLNFQGVYVVTEGDPDQATDLDLTGVTAKDSLGNISTPVDFNILKGIDANRPGISSIFFSPGDGKTLGIDSLLTVTMIAENMEPGLTIDSAMVNGINVFGTFAAVGGSPGYYTVEYTVQNGHGSINDATEAIPVTLILDDGTNLTSPIFEDSTVLSSPGIDDTAPVITNVTLSPGTGISGIGDTIIFTVTAGENGLEASTIIINGKDLINKFIAIGSNQYEIEYVIKSGDTNVSDSDSILFDLIVKDASGNVSLLYDETFLTVNDFPGIDASRPVITGVLFSPSSGVRAIGELITITINASENNLLADSISLNDSSFAITGTGPYTISYTVVEGDNDISDASKIPIYFTLTDGANVSLPYTTSDIVAGDCPGIDANRPGIVSVSFSPGDGNTLGIDSVLTVTLEAENLEPGLTASNMTVNGDNVIGTFAPVGGSPGYYTVEYTVQNGHGSINDATQAVPVNLVLDDIENLTLPAFTNSTILSTPGIDDNAPSISGVTLQPNSGLQGVGDTIIFTVNAGESGLIASTISINSKNLITKFTDIGSGQYEIEYVIQSGDNDIPDASAIPISITLKDVAGNVSNIFNLLLAGNCPDIDAHIPVINTVTSDATSIDTLIVGQFITFTVDIQTTDPDLIITPLQYNGQNLGWSAVGGGDTYEGTYTVTEGDPDQETSLQLTGVIASDPAGNVSNTVDGSDIAVAIDANTPVITPPVTSNASGVDTLIVGESIIFTVNVVTPDGSLTVSPATYNGRSLNWYTGDGGSTYTGIYNVTETDTDQGTPIQLPNVKLTDPAGNESNAVSGSDVEKSIDANTPSISSVAVNPVTMLYGQTYTVTIEVSDDNVDTWSLVSGTIAGFNLFNLSKQDLNTYNADFTVGNLGYDILPGDSFNVSNLVLSDPAGNLSNNYSAIVNQAGDPIYTILPTAKVTGNHHVCDGDSAELSFQLTGNAPWEIDLYDGTVITPVIGISESPYIHKVEAVDVNGLIEPDTVIYKITKVTDVNLNIVNITPVTDSAIVFAYEVPVVDITTPPGNKTYNINADADTLAGMPAGGVFSGNGIISSNSTFLPSSAGLGTWDIVYTYTVPSSGCYDSDTVEFEVIESDAKIEFDNGDDDWRCDYESIIGVTAEVITNPSIIGALKLYGAPAAITDHGDNTATIDVQLLSASTYEVTFEYTDGTFTTFTKSFTVESVGSSIDFTDLSDVCEDYDTINVDAYNLIPSGGTGEFIFSGSGGAFEYDPTDTYNNSGYFLPGQVTPGSYNLKYVYTTPNGCESDSVIKYFDVNALPNVSFTMNSVYNIDQGSDTIIGSPLGATGVFTPLSFMSNNGNGTASFDPADAGIGMHWVKYTYENTNGCVNADSMQIEVNEALGEITSSSGSFQFCYYGSSTDTLTGTPNPTDGTQGSFYIDNVSIPLESDNKILFNPQDYLAGDHTVKFEYNNGITTYIVYKTVNIDSIGNIYFTGLDIKYCENEDREVELTASYPGQDGVMKFTGSGITDDIVDNLGFFNPSDAGLGDNFITYTFTRDYSGCVKTYEDTVTVNKIPFVAFYPNEQCIVNSGDSVRFIADTLLTDSIVSWNWLFRNTHTSTDPSPKFSITTPGWNDVSLELETKSGCFDDVINSFYIGTRVELEFTFENECHGEAVAFTLSASNDPDDVDSLRWIFGGDGISDLSNLLNPTHQYTNPGGYNVIYEEYLKSCGRVADTVKVTVRPSIDLSIGEYLQEFEDNSDITGWVIEDYDEGANTWQWGEPVANTISTAASGINAFVTNLSGNYDNNEQGMVTSPCFDFSGMQRPMMKMDFIAYTEEDRDGAVIQYTKPNGDWATIGVPNDGINWYNSYIITGEPADQQLGWTGEIVGDDNSGWQTAMYRLDELRGRAGVRFRIVFGSNGDFTDEGFAFDNIQFGERKRIVLLENFTNIMDDDANITQEDVIDPILVKDSLDVINLNYHTSFPDVNNFNSFYPSGPSARALFYGVSAVPYSLVDGGERNYDYSLTNTLTESDIHKRMLIDPQFDISVRQDIQSNNFVVSSTVKALEEMTGQNVIVYVAIVEKTVLDVSDRYNNVLRTMLPDAAGILVEQDWIVGDSVNVYQIWSIHENVNTDSLITIVFVQDEDSKDIYQTAFTEEFSTITSVDEIIDNIMGIDYMVYPNPVKEILTVKLYKSLTHDINVNVYNSVGALVKSEKLSKGNYKLELNTNDLPSGVYYLRLPNTDKLFSTKKIIKTE